MPVSNIQRLERAREEVRKRCFEMFDRLCLEGKVRTLPARVDIAMQAFEFTGEVKETGYSIRWPEPLNYKTPGRLTGEIRSHRVSITQDPNRRFRAVIDGEKLNRLKMQFVEEELGIRVHRKRSGGNSETLSLAPFRHLADRYNDFDRSVEFTSYYDLEEE